MGLASNCGFGALAKLAGGDLRSLIIVLVMALSSYFMLSGPIASLRVMVFPIEVSNGSNALAHLVESLFGINPIIIASLISLIFMLWALNYKPLR